MEQLAPASSRVAQGFAPVDKAKSPGFVPPIEIPPMTRVALPVLVSTSCIGALVVPAVRLPNGTVAGVSEATGAAGAVPVPVSAEVCGEPVALSAT